MAEVLLFHHVLGQTEGFHAFADELRAAGHVVHTPDLFDGATFPTIETGAEFAGRTGFDVLGRRGVRAAEGLPDGVVHAGISFGVMTAQRLAQTRPGARGAVLLESCLPASELGAWPGGVPVQVHGMSEDPFFAGEGDIDAARSLVAEAEDGELFVYPGDQHLFTDRSLPSYDAAAAALVTERVLAFLARLA
ncbi:dienelactone hydrolase family protein [Cellulomonas sp. NS3]|uniref:dienelactone hydrolase family protein n=1 Tax=Cellulomonas sp. NS3 TaxID=2973977 RepID=UPI002162CFEA|nr:dienelactone hydrolase family protein [Cellulomonas sp. NS3]